MATAITGSEWVKERWEVNSTTSLAMGMKTSRSGRVARAAPQAAALRPALRPAAASPMAAPRAAWDSESTRAYP